MKTVMMKIRMANLLSVTMLLAAFSGGR